MAQRNTSSEYTGPSVPEMLKTHTLAKEIIARHNDPCPILDDQEILKLRGFVQDPVSAQTEQHGVDISKSGSLVAHIIRDWGTKETLLTEQEVRDLKEWFVNGGGKTDAETAELGETIGCGQGDFTVPLADAVGPSGHVIAIDPADPEYGTPPLSAAQAHVKNSPVGPQIDFIQATGREYLEATTECFDYVILAHSIWYFADPSFLHEILQSAVGKAKTVLIAEFGLTASRSGGEPHILTALATNALESFRDASSWRNLRCALSPAQVVAAAATAGWALESEKNNILTPPGEKYGWRETTMILKRPNYVDDVEALDESEKVKSMLLGMRDALAASVEKAGGMDALVNMDVWAGTFVMMK
ncbi:hypothetical protein QBC47DRAFT_409529 [Echria macrotheca]|uniref:Methyltransferase domain-containing protein n=1 Tax=Echria macrotheca TaxID=438768 RepID=A0AAJ0FGX1_9PEZI|nr:hypothetical protein QBC47DRAFT_409529 [Echria macrotheca]